MYADHYGATRLRDGLQRHYYFDTTVLRQGYADQGDLYESSFTSDIPTLPFQILTLTEGEQKRGYFSRTSGRGRALLMASAAAGLDRNSLGKSLIFRQI